MIRKVHMTALTLPAGVTIAACGAPQQEAPQRETPRQTESAAAPLRETTQGPPPAPVETPSGEEAGATPGKTAGNRIWKYNAASNHPESWGAGIPKGVKFLTAEEQTLVIGSEQFLDAVDTANGENLWVHRAAGLTALDSGDGRLYLATSGEGGYTVEAATGQRVWKQDAEGVHAIKADTGESLWSAKITWPVKHLMAVDGKVYATTGRPQLHGTDAGTGENKIPGGPGRDGLPRRRRPPVCRRSGNRGKALGEPDQRHRGIRRGIPRGDGVQAPDTGRGPHRCTPHGRTGHSRHRVRGLERREGS